MKKKEKEMYDSSDPIHVKKAEDEAKFNRSEYLKQIRDILSSKGGRSYMYEMISFCGVYQSAMTNWDVRDFVLGKREVGLKIISDVTDASPELLIKMLEESKSEDN